VTLAQTQLRVSAALMRTRFRFTNEQELQQGIATVLEQDPLIFEREVRLAPKDRIDFLVGGLGIEVKVDGTLSALTRQVYRYAQHEQIGALLVVSSLHRLARDLPPSINGKTISVHVVSRAFA
jgi:hypothetical protein